MRRALVGFRLDEVGHWVAMAACGHEQHVRHTPPFLERPWVVSADGRRATLGAPLKCSACVEGGGPMAAPIDHIVVTVENLDAVAARYEALGFTLTPRAQHSWGTANRLVQFEGANFIELLEIDRPELLPDHAPHAKPPTFSFGAFTRDFLASGARGGAMIVLAGSDSAADAARFARAGLGAVAPFDFGRAAILPDGRRVEVAFSLAFATLPQASRIGFFTCHNRFPENFWKPEFQRHTNRATGIREAVIVAEAPATLGGFLAGFAGSRVVAIDGGIAVAAGPHALTVLSPEAFARRFGPGTIDLSQGPRLAAIVVANAAGRNEITAASDACGIAIAWQPA